MSLIKALDCHVRWLEEKPTNSGIGFSLTASFLFEFLVVEAKVKPYYKEQEQEQEQEQLFKHNHIAQKKNLDVLPVIFIN